MHFEDAVILAVLRSSGLTMRQLCTKLFAFYGNNEAASRAPIRMLHLEQAGFVDKRGLPAVYSITSSGVKAKEDFDYAIEQYKKLD